VDRAKAGIAVVRIAVLRTTRADRGAAKARHSAIDPQSGGLARGEPEQSGRKHDCGSAGCELRSRNACRSGGTIAACHAGASAAAEPSASPSKNFVVRQLEREEIADLMRRGEAFIATGDFASARLVLQRAAEGGDPRAALTLAGTYDPIVLEKLGIQGFASD